MERLKLLIPLARQHYEKLILSLALLGVAAAVLVLYQASQSEREKIRDYVKGLERRGVKGVKPADVSRLEAALKRAQSPAGSLAGDHHLISPVKWQRKADGSLIKVQTGAEVGPEAMTIVRVAPLHFMISLDRVPTAGSYYFGVAREAAEKFADRRKISTFATQNSTNQFFTVRESSGPPEDPAVVLELVPGKDRVTVSKDKPYKRVDGYQVDLKYPLTNEKMSNLRVGSTFRMSGEEYKVIAINTNNVKLTALINDKPYTVSRFEAPESAK